MNIFNTCQTDNYASDYIETKKQRALTKDIKIFSKKKTRRISTDLPFDLNVSLKSSINYKTNDINKPLDNDISGVIYIDPNNKLFNTNCPYKYLDYTFKPKVYSNIRPTIVITAAGVSDGAITKANPIELTFTTSEATTNFVSSDITVTNGTISSFNATSSTVYTATFTPTTDGAYTIDVFVDSFIGIGTGNYNIAATQFKLIYDKTPPSVDEFKLSDTSLKIGDTATVTLKFSEVVAALSSNDDITVVNGVLTTMTSSDNITWTGIFTPTVNIEDATNILTLATTYTDIAGNTGIGNTTDIFLIDTTPPTVLSFTTVTHSGSYKASEQIIITANTSEAIQIGNTITVTLDTGTEVVLTALAAGTTLEGTYTVAAGNNSLSLTVSSFTIGTVADTVGNLMTSTTLPATSLIFGSKIIVIDTTPPTVAFSSGAFTNDDTPIVNGTAEANSTVTVVIQGITYSPTVASDGKWSVDTSIAPTSGTLSLVIGGVGNSVSVTAADAAGNTSTIEQTLVIDTTVTYFPDTNFYNAIINEIGSGAESSATNYLYNVSINTITSLDVSGETISDLTGIEGFTALEILKCYNNDLHSLDVSANTVLTDLWCYNNDLHSLDVSANTVLTDLWCYDNSLDALDVTQNTALTDLLCYDNSLNALDVTQNTALTKLQCYKNSIASLDVTQNTALILLNCNDNSIASLDVTQNTALLRLDCYNNSLTTLDVTKNTALTMLLAHGNSLTTLDVTQNTALTHLYCNENSLTTLDVTQNTALTDLWCYKNNFSGGGTSVITTAFTNTFNGTFDADPQNVGVTVTGNFCKVADEAVKTHFDDSYNASIPTNANYYF